MSAETGRGVLIAGAAGGVGRAIAARYAGSGARLLLTDVDRGAVEALAASLPGAAAAALDVADAEAMAGLGPLVEARLGRLDAAINAAGVLHGPTRLVDLPVETFDRAWAVNARGAFLFLREALRILIVGAEASGDGRGGAIVTVASVAGLVGAPTLGGYAAAKHAAVGLTRTAADEAARYGIRVNALCPSFTDTGMLAALGPAAEDAGRLTRRVPMRRLATAEEVAEAAVWLASDANKFMTGQAVALDGGLTAV